MSRPTSVSIVAVLALLGSFLTLLMGALFCFVAFAVPTSAVEQQPYARFSIYFMVAVFFGLSVWGTTTSLGLWRLKGWARTSTLIFSASLVFLGLCSIPFLFLMPVPSAPGQADAVFRGVLIGMAIFYGLLTLLGIWWLVLFNRPGIKAAFQGAALPGAQPPLPLSITSIAWLFLTSAPLSPIAIWLGWPTTFLGVIITGWVAKLAYVVFTVWVVAAGYGLLRRKAWAYSLTLALFAFGLVNAAAFYALPGQDQKLLEISRAILPANMDPGLIQQPPAWVSLLFALGGIGLPLYFLVTRKKRYLEACKVTSPVATLPPQG